MRKIVMVALLLAVGGSRVAHGQGGAVFGIPDFDDFRHFTLAPQPGFTLEERQLIEDAQEALIQHFPEWIHMEHVQAAEAYHLSPHAKKLTRLADCLPPDLRQIMQEQYRSADDMVLLVQWTFFAQKNMAAFLNQKDGWKVIIHPFYKEPDEEGRGVLAQTHSGIKFDLDIDCSGVNISPSDLPLGRFEMWLNQYYLPETGPRELAGTVVHEMLHNMGHNHPSDMPGARDRRWQINAYADDIGEGWVNERCSAGSDGTFSIYAP